MVNAISQTKLKVRIKRKTNPELLELLQLARKNKAWMRVIKIISSSTRQYSSVNLQKIDKETKAGDTVVIIGKVLGSGSLTKKVRICSLGISEDAKEKLKETKSEFVSILEEIKSNAKAAGIKLIR
ncbi:50S ribosomal protein L18e [Candidatus Pacearchaeota archaeon]|nr:50S ribosomal protein L18e [Candidatus Pacearchaeota archaeon]